MSPVIADHPPPAPPAAALPAAASRTVVARGWRQVLRDWLLVSGSTIVCQAIGIVTGFALRFALNPAQMGVWQALKLFLTNANYANLGISKGAARELSMALGRGRPEEAQHGIDLAFTVNTLTSLGYAALLIVAGVWIGAGSSTWSWAWAVGLTAVGLLSVLQRYATFQVTLMRASQQFGPTSQLAILEAVLTLAVAVSATFWAGLNGLYLGTLGVLLASIVFLHCRGALPWRWAWDVPEIRRLVAIGSPILLAGVISTVFRSLDKLLILGCMSDREFQLGCYSLALMVTGQLYGLGNMLAIVIGPRLSQRFGRSGDRGDVARLTVEASELQAATTVLPAALTLVLAPPLLGWLLPAYTPGLPAMCWLIPGVVALNVALLPAQYLVSIEREKWSLAAVLAATGITAVLNWSAIKAGWGLSGVAASTSLGYFLYLLLVAGPLWRDLDLPGRVRLLFMHTLALGPTLAAALLACWLVPASIGLWLAAVVRAAAVLIVWSGCVALGWSWGGWRQALRNEEASSRPACAAVNSSAEAA